VESGQQGSERGGCSLRPDHGAEDPGAVAESGQCAEVPRSAPAVALSVGPEGARTNGGESSVVGHSWLSPFERSLLPGNAHKNCEDNE
jgi:hypothetical protein